MLQGHYDDVFGVGTNNLSAVFQNITLPANTRVRLASTLCAVYYLVTDVQLRS